VNDGALSDLLVLDFSRVLAGPYCTMLLGDLGAEVIKVERPGQGDGTRGWGPPWIGRESAYFLSVNRNKRSLALDLKSDRGREIARALADRADVVVENFTPGTMEGWGLGYEELSRPSPGLIYCSISGYGQTGPDRERPGYDFMIQAQGGLMSITGLPGGEPTKVGVAIVDVTAGLYAAHSILAALHHRERTGEGQHVDIALLDAQLGWLVNVAQNHFATGEVPRRYGNAHPNIVPYESFPAVDGSVALAVGTDAQFRRFCRAADLREIGEDPHYRTNAGRVEHRAELVPRLRDAFRKRTVEEWLELLDEAGVPAAPVNDVPTALALPQAEARGMVQKVRHPELGSLSQVGPVPHLSRTPAAIRSAPPRLGEHSPDVLEEHLELPREEVLELEDDEVIGRFPPRSP